MPRAFLTYTDPDEEFTNALYDALCAHGIRPTMDRRDFLLGDDVPKAVFDEGIGQSDGVVVILSRHSATDAWHHAQVSAATISAIELRTRVFTVVVDALPHGDIPTFLKTKLSARAGQKSVDDIAIEIAHALLRDRPSPTIAPPPEWAKVAIAGITNLTAYDEQMLARCCEIYLDHDELLVRSDWLLEYLRSRGVSDDEAITSLLMLLKRRFIEKASAPRGMPYPWAVSPTTYGMEQYLRAYRSEAYATAVELVIAAMCDLKTGRAADLLERCEGVSRHLLRHIAQRLADAGDITIQHPMGGFTWLAHPTLRRRLR